MEKTVFLLPIKPQKFPFFPSFMNYILQNVTPEQLLKLYQSCKYFYSKLQITIASNVRYAEYPIERTIKIIFNKKNEKDLSSSHSYSNDENLWLSDYLNISLPFSKYVLIGDEFFNKIYRNSLKELKINAKVTIFKELQILCKSPNLTNVNLETEIKDENDRPIPIEDIMVLFPNIKHFEISHISFTLDSFQKLLKFKFSNKIQIMKFYNMKTVFDPITLCKFLKENLDDDAILLLTFFCFSERPRPLFRLLRQVEKLIDSWETKKPKILII